MQKSDFTIIQPEDSKNPLKLSKEELGRDTWAVLHSIGAAYPSIAQQDDKEAIDMLFKSLIKLYPCKICKEHFKQMIGENPIKANNREELVTYLCNIHNLVNQRLNKTIYDCSKAFDIWGGDCGCDAI